MNIPRVAFGLGIYHSNREPTRTLVNPVGAPRGVIQGMAQLSANRLPRLVFLQTLECHGLSEFMSPLCTHVSNQLRESNAYER